jgi:hypothetical protein
MVIFCKSKCFFKNCKNICAIIEDHEEHFCENEHECEELCEENGYCKVEKLIDIGEKKTQIGKKEKW